MPQPTYKHDADRVAKEILKFYPLVVMIIATVGAQMSFTVVLSKIETPDASRADFVRRMIGLSWLLFLGVTWFAFLAGVIDIIHGPSVEKGVLREVWFLKYGVILLVLSIEGMTFAAFLCMAIAVKEFDRRLGWWAIAIISIGAAITLLTTALHGWRVNKKEAFQLVVVWLQGNFNRFYWNSVRNRK
jgi:hypothetical protein